MKRFFIFAIIVLFATWLGVQLHASLSYIVIVVAQWVITLPLWLAVLALLIFFWLLYFLLRVLRFGGNLSSNLHRWSSHRKQHQSQQANQRGLLALLQGEWVQAEYQLKKGLNADNMLINYMALAWAAQNQQADERCQKYLRLAVKYQPKAKLAIDLTKVRLQLEGGSREQALLLLQELAKTESKNSYILHLLKQVYVQQQDWLALASLLPMLEKDKQQDKIELKLLRQQITLAQLQVANSVEQVQQAWQHCPKPLRSESSLILTYAKSLQRLHEKQQLASFIVQTLKKQWLPELVQLYSQLGLDNMKQALKTAEGWLHDHSNDVELLTCIGRLSEQNQLWGQARAYYEKSIKQQPNAVAYFALGKLFESLEGWEKSTDCYREGLALTMHVDAYESNNSKVSEKIL